MRWNILKAKKILIVDDDIKDSELMREILEKEKYKVDVANNGATALDFMNDSEYSLILIDIKLPTLTGYDLLRLLRERIDGKSKMVYVTVVPKKDVDMYKCDGFIQKPFSKETFLKKVKSVLK